MRKNVLIFLLIASLLFVSLPVYADTEKEIKDLQTQVDAVTEEVNQYNAMISDYQQEINMAQEDIDSATEKINELKEDINLRMRAAYMYGENGILELLFSANNTKEFLTFYDVSMKMIKEEINLKEQYQLQKNVIKKSKEKMEKELSKIAEIKGKSEKAQSDLSEKINSTKKELVKEALTENYTGQGAVVSPIAAEMLAKSGWVWPIDANARNAFLMTSLMGPRESPGGIGSTQHGGVDIGAAYGSVIVAAQSGVVTESGGNGGYGQCVTVKTDDGYITMYAHLSSIFVTEGQRVEAGQPLGTCGSTGNSTGPHLHFEVRLDGVKINGLSFYGNDILGKLTYDLYS